MLFGSSVSRQNQPGRMDTSVSAGIQQEPHLLPLCNVSTGGEPAPGVKPSGLSVLQLTGDALPLSLLTQRQSGPTSLNITAAGCNSRTVCRNRGQSYSCLFPPGPSPQAPSNHCSNTGP